MFPQSRVKLLVFWGYFIRVTAVMFLGLWAVMQVFNGIASLGVATAQTAGIAFWAHIGGFAFGFVMGLLYRGRASRFTLETREVRHHYSER
jgi:membrane associated rhomboid family serine protease